MRCSRKGQYQVVNEILVFAIGIVLVGFVIVIFQGIQTSLNDQAINDHFETVSNLVSAGIVKAVESGDGSAVRLEIPEKISGETYVVSIRESDNEYFLLVHLFANTGINASQKLFNIGRNYRINGEIISSARNIEIVVNGTNVDIHRFR